ncbi:MAG TPA: hypothetical protein VFE15_02135 [Marmoricola sp.]|nr:hypothetical protein [Marmoricola sp.]
MNTFVIVLHSLVVLADKTPADKDVKAGWGAFWIFIGMVVAVGLLGWSLTRHLKKTQFNADSGAFGDEPTADEPAQDKPSTTV